ncbi:cupin domain-containing protein [Acidipila sp. EB88]|uniref:cupin domain-containing protein n=1 Tax=Acidipila sp. EB88 TaxID=2305226 RepID=UPI0013153C89|nr:cupin domain-containing protein [Acidipila sp. EB88]
MQTHFDIFGQPVELLVLSEQTGGMFSVGRQTCDPDTGTPPHTHRHEDEIFSVVSGRFELFNGEAWTEIPPGAMVLAPRGGVHCFRNSGDTPGTIQFICGGDRFDHFLEGLSRYILPHDLQSMIDYSATFGIFYPTLPAPTLQPVSEVVTLIP